MSKLTIIRGPSGSGKSTLAQRIIKKSSTPTLHLEADMYMFVNGEYKFSPTKLKDAHNWCLKMTQFGLEAGFDVIVSNTATRLWELYPYLDSKEGSEVEVLRTTGRYNNVHNVPDEVVEAMRDRFEDFEGEKLF